MSKGLKIAVLLAVFLTLFMSQASAESLNWNSSSAWDNAVEASGVVHESVENTDHMNNKILKKGYSAANPEISEGLVGYWPLDEDSGGIAYDFSGNEYDGSTNGGVTQGATGLLGTSSYSFDGSDSYVSLGSSPEITTGLESGATFTFWFNTDDASKDQRILDNDYAENSWQTLIKDNRLQFGVEDGSWHQLQSSTTLSSNTWYFGVARWDGSTMDIFLNGEQEGSQSAGATFHQNDVVVGLKGQDRPTQPFDGNIEDIRIFSEPLTQSQIQSMYESAAETSTLTTEWKNFSSKRDTSSLQLDTDAFPKAQSINAFIESDTDGDGNVEEISEKISLDGSSSYTVEGLSNHSESFRLNLELKTDDLPTTPTTSSFSLTAEESDLKICNIRGPLNQCISNSTHEISGEKFDVSSIFESRTNAVFEAFNGRAILNLTNPSTISGLWRGNIEIQAERPRIISGAKFRPQGERIVIGN